MPLHYAITDFAIVVAALLGARWLWGSGKVLLAGGMVCFAIPALIGTVRIVSRQIDQLAAMHSGSSALLGLTGVALLTAGLLFDDRSAREHAIAAVITVLGSMAIFANQFALALLMGLLLIVCIATGAVWTMRSKANWMLPLGFAILLANSIFVRKAPWLSEAGAWHAFHLVLAMGLLLVARGVVSHRESDA